MLVDFEDLVSAFTAPRAKLIEGARLQVCSQPFPFVSPMLSTDDDFRAAHVVFIKATAAVGKTTLAEALSAELGAPRLDLSRVRVATHSLRGMVDAEIIEPGDPLARFGAGELPCIIDAIDEGRLLAGNASFDEFLETSWQLLALNSSGPPRPCLVVIGRPESWELSAASLLEYTTVRSATLTLEFFDRSRAEAVVQQRTQATAKRFNKPAPSGAVVTDIFSSYSSAVAGALGMGVNDLWVDEHGRAFAGYAPVLIALADAIARSDNPSTLTGALAGGTAASAWESLEGVARWVTDREGEKLRSLLRPRLGVDPPNEVYDAAEQFRALFCFLEGRDPLTDSAVSLTGEAFAEYAELVNQWIGDHPFIADRDFYNPVFAGVALAFGVAEGLVRPGGAVERALAGAAAQPFLWRSFEYVALRLDSAALIEGPWLGYILSSRATDPDIRGRHVRGTMSLDSDAVSVEVGPGFENQQISVLPPVMLFGTVRDAEFDVRCDVTLQGVAPRDGRGRVMLLEDVVVIASRLNIAAETVELGGYVWFEAAQVEQGVSLAVSKREGAVAGWRGDGFEGQYPWSRQERTLMQRPGINEGGSLLERLVTDLAWRAPATGVVVTSTNEPADPRMRWIEREYPGLFAPLVSLMISHGVAAAEPMQASGQNKRRIRFNPVWIELCEAIRNPDVGTAAIRSLASDIREEIGSG